MRTIVFYNKILTFRKESKAKEKENNTSLTIFTHFPPLKSLTFILSRTLGHPPFDPFFSQIIEGSYSIHKSKPLYSNPYTNPSHLIGKQLLITLCMGYLTQQLHLKDKLEIDKQFTIRNFLITRRHIKLLSLSKFSTLSIYSLC